jgi:hypothetical protein
MQYLRTQARPNGQRVARSGLSAKTQSSEVLAHVPALLVLQRLVGNQVVSRFLDQQLRRTVVKRCDTTSCSRSPAGRAPMPMEALLQRAAEGESNSMNTTATGATCLTSPRFASFPLLQDCCKDRTRMTLGHSGDAVKAIQQALLDLGYGLGVDALPGPGGIAVSGRYRWPTWEAVKKFKTDKALGWETVGDVGPGTTRCLDALFGGTPAGGAPSSCKPAPTPTCPACPEDPRTPGCPACPSPAVPTTCDALKGAEHSGAGDNPHLGKESEGELRALIVGDCLLPISTGLCSNGFKAKKAFEEGFAKADSLLESPPMDLCGPPVPGGVTWPGAPNLPGKINGPDDAFRHCFASCLLASRTSPGWAERVGTDHENSQDPSSLPGRMDLHNNFMGRSLSKPGDDSGCASGCLDAVRSGNLITVRVKAPKCDDTVCLGPSSQVWP